MNSDMNSRYSSWSWIHTWIHIMNSYKISWSWIHMWHFMTYEFIYEFMYMKNIVKSYLNSGVPRFQMCAKIFPHASSKSLLFSGKMVDALLVWNVMDWRTTMFTMFGLGYGRCVGWEYNEEDTTTWLCPSQEHCQPNELKLHTWNTRLEQMRKVAATFLMCSSLLCTGTD